MSHRIFKPIAVLSIALFIVSCSLLPVSLPNPVLPMSTTGPTLPTPMATLTPTPIPPSVKLIGYNYKLKDVGDGWNEGRLSIALENISDQLVGNIRIDTRDVMVETKEDKTYPVTLYRLYTESSEGSPAQEIDFSGLPKVIPPHFRWTRVGRSGEQLGQYYLKFRAAIVAHPTRIVFPRQAGYSIDLTTAQAAATFPADASALTAKPLTALTGKVLTDEPNKLLVTLDGTGVVTDQTAQLRYTVVNRDKLDAHTATVAVSILAFYFGDGAVWPLPVNSPSDSVTAGPGQTVKKTLSLGQVFMDKRCNANLFALFQEGGQNTLYKLSFCK
ncbi:MAG: hypothetical protein HZB51_18470 [Chloroflexi bacterium]|nr:hypothetical protein [Chloroflexota bacterium]